MNPLRLEANIIAGMDDFAEQFSIPALQTDDGLYSIHAKATAGNQLPMKVLEDALFDELLGSVAVEIEHPTAVEIVEKSFMVARGSTPQPLAKRNSSAGLDPHFDQGRRVLSVKRDGKLKITKFEGGELLEIV